MMNTKPVFATEAQAIDWMYEQLEDEEFFDDYRFAFVDDPEGMAKYEDTQAGACCGNSDFEIIVDGREAQIRCSYGH